jgi:hypothetical protein
MPQRITAMGTTPAVENKNPTSSLEYTQRLYEGVLHCCKNADAKVQVILPLDGILSTSALSSSHAISCIWSWIYRPAELSGSIGDEEKTIP